MNNRLHRIFESCSTDLLSLGRQIHSAMDDGFKVSEIDAYLYKIGVGKSREFVLERVSQKKYISELALELRSIEVEYHQKAAKRALAQAKQKHIGTDIIQRLIDNFERAIQFSVEFPRKLTLPQKLFCSKRDLTVMEKRDLRLLSEFVWKNNKNSLGRDLKSDLLAEGVNGRVIREFIRTSKIDEIASDEKSKKALELLERIINPILYLRSFKDDKTQHSFFVRIKNKLGLGTSERIIVSQLQRYSDFVALGVPGELGQQKGESFRLYLPHDNWKNVVRHLLLRAERIVIRVSETPGIIWELIEALHLVEPQRLIIVTPTPQEAKDQNKVKRIIAEAVNKSNGITISPNEWPMVLTFQANGFPKFISSYRRLHSALSHAVAEETNSYLLTQS